VFNGSVLASRLQEFHTNQVWGAAVGRSDLHSKPWRWLPAALACFAADPGKRRRTPGARGTLGAAWRESWVPGAAGVARHAGGINLAVLFSGSNNLAGAWDLRSYAGRARFMACWAQGDHWFPAANADALDHGVLKASCLRLGR